MGKKHWLYAIFLTAAIFMVVGAPSPGVGAANRDGTVYVPKLYVTIDYMDETAIISVAEYTDDMPNILYSFNRKQWFPIVMGETQVSGKVDISSKISKKDTVIYVKVDGMSNDYVSYATIKAQQSPPLLKASKGIPKSIEYSTLEKRIYFLEEGIYECRLAENVPFVVEVKADAQGNLVDNYIDCTRFEKGAIYIKNAATSTEFASKETKVAIKATPKAPRVTIKQGIYINGMKTNMEYAYFTENVVNSQTSMGTQTSVDRHWWDWQDVQQKGTMVLGEDIPAEATILIVRTKATSKAPPSLITQIDLITSEVITRVVEPNDPVFEDYEITFNNPAIKDYVTRYIKGEIQGVENGNPENLGTTTSILKSHVNQIHELSVSSSDLSDLIHFNNLEKLELTGGNITDLSVLKNLDKLHTLTLSSIGTNDITPLSQLNKLKVLEITNSNVSNLRPLERLYNLQDLNLYNNDITDITSLSGLKSLKTLDLATNTSLSNINPLRNLTGLEYLNISGIAIKDLSPLVNLTSLVWLEAENNNLRENDFAPQTKPITGLTRLQVLNLRNTGISDLSGLSKFAKLKELDLSNNPIGLHENQDTALLPLRGLKNIVDLNLSNTQLRAVQGINGNQSLVVLDLSDNPDLTDVNLGQMKNLSELDLSNCGLVAANEPQFYALRNLYALDVSGNREILFEHYSASSSSLIEDMKSGVYNKQLVLNPLDFYAYCTYTSIPPHSSTIAYSYTVSLTSATMFQQAAGRYKYHTSASHIVIIHDAQSSEDHKFHLYFKNQ